MRPQPSWLSSGRWESADRCGLSREMPLSLSSTQVEVEHAGVVLQSLAGAYQGDTAVAQNVGILHQPERGDGRLLDQQESRSTSNDLCQRLEDRRDDGRSQTEGGLIQQQEARSRQ